MYILNPYSERVGMVEGLTLEPNKNKTFQFKYFIGISREK